MADTTPLVTAIIVTYNSRQTIDAALDPLKDGVASNLVSCIVVDNASSDGTVEHVEDRHAWVRIIRGQANLGFARACNCGIEATDSKYVLLLNPDAALSGDGLARLATFLEENPRAGICGPAVRAVSGGLQSTNDFPTPWKIMLRPLWPRWASRGQRLVEPGEAPSTTGWVCGAILLVRRCVLEDVGSLDPRFFLYFEETDLCYRARQSGWETWTVGESVGQHANAASAKHTNGQMMSGVLSEHYFKSRFYYLTKHFGWSSAVLAEVGEIAAMCIRAAVDRLRGRTYETLMPRLRAPILRLPHRADTADSYK